LLLISKISQKIIEKLVDRLTMGIVESGKIDKPIKDYVYVRAETI